MFEKMNGETPDLTKDNIDKLKQLFPEIVTDGKIDFEKLQVILGKEIDDAPDRYNFTWHGKKETLQFAQQPSKGTLRPIKEKSKNWDTTGNLYIEGDNLEVLKLLQKSYNNKVKMIYIDPPYNTGNDFIYKDNFKNSVDSYLELTGQKDGEGNKFTTNTESNGRYHTDWLNMMYPRLKLARNLLTDDGVIFISIDDGEADNLRKMCNEVFGESNFVADLCVVNNLKGRNDKKYIARANERLLMYVKSLDFDEHGLELDDKILSEYNLNDNFGKYRLLELRKRGGPDTRKDRPKMYYPFYVNPETGDISLERSNYFSIEALPVKSNGDDGRWRWGRETASKKIEQLFGKQVGNKYNIYEKNYLESEDGARRVRPKSVLSGAAYSTDVATKEYRALMGKLDFTNPKPVALLSDLIIYATAPNENATILDFFSGSATTAHGVFYANSIDNGNRKFIMVQLPEILDEESEAYKEGYRSICDIGEERIRRAGQKVKNDLIEKNNKEGMLSDNQANPDDLDIGFKIFRLDSSNLTEWQVNFDELESNIDLFESNVLKERSELDILFEIMLKNGLDLTYPVTEIIEDSCKIYDIAVGNLFVCLNDNINRDVARKIAALRKEYGIETSQVVFKDSGFQNDTEKLNCYEILKEAGYQDSDLLSI